MTLNWPHEHRDEGEQPEGAEERDTAPAHEEESPTATLTATPETEGAAPESTEGELEHAEGIDDSSDDVAPGRAWESPTATLTADADSESSEQASAVGERDDAEGVADDSDAAPATEEERPAATLTSEPETDGAAQESTVGEPAGEGVEDDSDAAPAIEEERPAATLTSEPETDGTGPTSTDEPTTVSAEPDDAEAPATPSDPIPALAGFQALEPGEIEGYRSRWESIQIAFLDDPKGAAEQAHAVVGEVIGRLTERHQAMRDELDRRSDQGDDTESMRLAVRTYRTFFHILVRG
jgi:hypothetical protein